MAVSVEISKRIGISMSVNFTDNFEGISMDSEQRAVVNISTGEIEIEFEGDYKIVSKKQSDNYIKFKDKYGKKIISELEDNTIVPFNVGNFHKLVTKEYTMILKELNDTEISFLARVMSHTAYRSCGVQSGRKLEFTMKELSELLSMNEKTMRKAIISLISKRMISKCVSSGYRFKIYVNPWICHKGSEIDATLKHMFGDYQVRSKNMKKWKDL